MHTTVRIVTLATRKYKLMSNTTKHISTRAHRNRSILLAIYISISLATNAFSQNEQTIIKGTISYLNGQNVYVKFENTEGIRVGDSLFVARNNILIPAIRVNNLSSVSCVGSLLGLISLSISTPLFGKIRIEKKKDILIHKEFNESRSVNDQAISAIPVNVAPLPARAQTDGRLALSTYSTITGSTNDQRYRYNYSLNAQHINDSKFSLENYISLTHKSNELNLIGKNINKYLKIYSLALKYDLSKSTNITLGRKVNLNMANVGAVDGLHFETVKNNLTYGVVVGSRPDFFDYSFNPNLMQFGLFTAHNVQKENGNMQTSLAFFDQMNKFKTDRRFAYFQHTNSLLKKVDLFCSFEFDFFTMKNLQPQNTLELTSTYLSLRYKPWRKLSVFVSYDARKNVYYYETFKNQIDSIIDKESRQGLRFQFTYRPTKLLSMGGSGGYRYQKSDKTPSINGYSYISFSQIPLILTTVTVNATLLKSSYIDGMVYGISLSRDIINGKVYTELQYRMVNYTYKNSHTTLHQDIAELSFSWRIAKKLTLSADLEATHETGNNYGRIYLSLIHRIGGGPKANFKRAAKVFNF